MMAKTAFFDKKTGKMEVSYLSRGDTDTSSRVDNKHIALNQAKTTFNRLLKLPADDQASFNSNLQKAIDMDALQDWRRLLRENPTLIDMEDRYVIGSFSYSGKSSSTKVRPSITRQRRFRRETCRKMRRG